MKSLLLAVLSSSILLALGGCNTMRGLGEDISALGRSLSSASGAGSSGH